MSGGNLGAFWMRLVWPMQQKTTEAQAGWEVGSALGCPKIRTAVAALAGVHQHSHTKVHNTDTHRGKEPLKRCIELFEHPPHRTPPAERSELEIMSYIVPALQETATAVSGLDGFPENRVLF